MQLYPISPLTLLITKGGNASQLGDFIQGGILMGIYAFFEPSSLLWLISLSIISIVGVFGVTLFVNSLIFFFPKLLRLSDFIIQVFLGAGLYPSQNFQGAIKWFLYIAMVFAFVFYPVEVMRHYLSPAVLLISISCAVGINPLAFKTWSLGIRRVESGRGGGVVEWKYTLNTYKPLRQA